MKNNSKRSLTVYVTPGQKWTESIVQSCLYLTRHMLSYSENARILGLSPKNFILHLSETRLSTPSVRLLLRWPAVGAADAAGGLNRI